VPFPFIDVGEGDPATFYCLQRKPKEPHLSRGHQAVGFSDNTTPATIEHQMDSPGMRYLCHPLVSPVIQQQTLQG
jgi:hypothetical protein